jgi:hypothetical protein
MIEREQRPSSFGALSDTARANIGFVLSHEQFPVVTTVFIHSAQEDQSSVIDFFGQRVLPQLQRQRRTTAAAR